MTESITFKYKCQNILENNGDVTFKLFWKLRVIFLLFISLSTMKAHVNMRRCCSLMDIDLGENTVGLTTVL